MYNDKQKGSVLIFSVLMLGVIMTITLGLGEIFLPKIRVITDAAGSAAAGYAADSGLEWCLYVSRKTPAPSATPLPTLSNGATVVVYRNNSSTVATCYEGGNFDYRAVGTYRAVTRSFIVQE